MTKRFLINIIVMMISLPSEAAQVFDPYLAKCSYENFPKTSASMPLSFNHSNNIIASAGIPLITTDKLVLIRGKLLDQNCIPIAEANIKAWNNKANPNNKEYDQSDAVDTIIAAKNTLGAGSAITDNLGIFHFLVSLPANSTSGNLNLSINHPDFTNINTKLSFYRNELNIEDVYLPEAILDVDLNSNGFNSKIPVYNKIIVLKGKNKYRRF